MALGTTDTLLPKKQKEVFEIKKSKDGFSVDKLKEISKTVENLSLPITMV